MAPLYWRRARVRDATGATVVVGMAAAIPALALDSAYRRPDGKQYPYLRRCICVFLDYHTGFLPGSSLLGYRSVAIAAAVIALRRFTRSATLQCSAG
jgi:hypothetical protein